MAKAKKSVNKAKTHEMIDTKTEDLMIPSSPPASFVKTRGRWVAVAVIIFLVGFFLVKQGYIVAAMVNGSPIFRWELNSQLSHRFGEQTLESMITEELIMGAAQKEGIVVTADDVNAKITSITQTLGPNVNLEELLRYQGMTRADFEGQVRLQLTVEKMLSRDVTVTDDEVSSFITENRDTMIATDEAALAVEARDAVMSQKTSEKMQPWLMELRENAKISKFL
jgi:hypothetical protein